MSVTTGTFYPDGRLATLTTDSEQDFADALNAIAEYQGALGQDVVLAAIQELKEQLMTVAEQISGLKDQVFALTESETRQEARINELLQAQLVANAALEAANTELKAASDAKDAHIAEQDANLATVQAALDAATAVAADPAALADVAAGIKAVIDTQDAFKA